MRPWCGGRWGRALPAETGFQSPGGNNREQRGRVRTTRSSESDLAPSPGSVTFCHCNPSRSLPVSGLQFYFLHNGSQW